MREGNLYLLVTGIAMTALGTTVIILSGIEWYAIAMQIIGLGLMCFSVLKLYRGNG